MAIKDIYKRQVVTVTSETTVSMAAKLMRQKHVGDVIVVKKEGKRQEPIGIVTDRDVVVEIVAIGLDPTVLTVGDIMVGNLAVAREDTGVFEAIRHMRNQGVRRMPVIGKTGNLLGILTLDDLLELLASEMSALTSVPKHEREIEIKTRR